MVSMTRGRQRRNMKKVLPVLVLVAFTLFSVELIAKGGLEGLAVLREPWALQIAVDLCIACFFAGAWLRRDARERGIAALPYLILLPFLGSIAVLAYLVRREVLAGSAVRLAHRANLAP